MTEEQFIKAAAKHAKKERQNAEAQQKAAEKQKARQIEKKLREEADERIRLIKSGLAEDIPCSAFLALPSEPAALKNSPHTSTSLGAFLGGTTKRASAKPPREETEKEREMRLRRAKEKLKMRRGIGAWQRSG